MKRVTVKKIFWLLFIISGCSGGFESSQIPSIFLIGPEDLCQEGIEKPNNELEIEFNWNISEGGNFSSYLVEVTDTDTEEIITKLVDGDSLSTRITLERGKPFTWQIKGTITGNTEMIISKETLSFYSESLPSVNLAPLPVIIILRKVNATTIEITWEVSEREVLDNLEFEVFFGTEENPSEKLENTKVEPEPIIKEVFENGSYFVKITTTKKVGNDYYSTSSFKKILINGI
jgi:hypothetical protein